jgi:hypothetical protein
MIDIDKMISFREKSDFVLSGIIAFRKQDNTHIFYFLLVIQNWYQIYLKCQQQK